MKDKSAIVMFTAALIIAMAAASMVEFSDYQRSEGNIFYEKSHSLLFEKTSVSYPASVNVTRPDPSQNVTIGFDTGTGEIDFGTLPSGSISRKFFRVSNPTETRERISIIESGSIAKIMKLSPNGFILLPGQGLNVSASVEPSTEDYGLFDGQITIVSTKPSFKSLDLLIQ